MLPSPLTDTYLQMLASLPTAEPHPWWFFHRYSHKPLHLHSIPKAPSHLCWGGWWLHGVWCYTGSIEQEQSTEKQVCGYFYPVKVLSKTVSENVLVHIPSDKHSSWVRFWKIHAIYSPKSTFYRSYTLNTHFLRSLEHIKIVGSI